MHELKILPCNVSLANSYQLSCSFHPGLKKMSPTKRRFSRISKRHSWISQSSVNLKHWSNEDECWRELMKVPTFAGVWPPTLIDSRALLSTLSWFKFWWKMMRVFARLSGNIRSTLTQLLFSFDGDMRVEKILIKVSPLVNSQSSSFDWGFRCQMRMTVEKSWQASVRVCMRVYSTISCPGQTIIRTIRIAWQLMRVDWILLVKREKALIKIWTNSKLMRVHEIRWELRSNTSESRKQLSSTLSLVSPRFKPLLSNEWSHKII
jgi:hypothetical protein